MSPRSIAIGIVWLVVGIYANLKVSIVGEHIASGGKIDLLNVKSDR